MKKIIKKIFRILLDQKGFWRIWHHTPIGDGITGGGGTTGLGHGPLGHGGGLGH